MDVKTPFKKNKKACSVLANRNIMMHTVYRRNDVKQLGIVIVSYVHADGQPPPQPRRTGVNSQCCCLNKFYKCQEHTDDGLNGGLKSKL